MELYQALGIVRDAAETYVDILEDNPDYEDNLERAEEIDEALVMLNELMLTIRQEGNTNE